MHISYTMCYMLDAHQHGVKKTKNERMKRRSKQFISHIEWAKIIFSNLFLSSFDDFFLNGFTEISRIVRLLYFLQILCFGQQVCDYFSQALVTQNQQKN